MTLPSWFPTSEPSGTSTGGDAHEVVSALLETRTLLPLGHEPPACRWQHPAWPHSWSRGGDISSGSLGNLQSDYRPHRSTACPSRKLCGHHNTVSQGQRPDEITTTINERSGSEWWKKHVSGLGLFSQHRPSTIPPSALFTGRNVLGPCDSEGVPRGCYAACLKSAYTEC